MQGAVSEASREESTQRFPCRTNLCGRQAEVQVQPGKSSRQVRRSVRLCWEPGYAISPRALL